MEINVNSYLEKYEKEHKDYNRNDLQSNQEHFAKLLQCVFVTGCFGYEKKAQLYDKYQELMRYCEAIIINREIPKYVQERIGEGFLSQRIILVNRLKFEPETFGEMRYVDEILNLPEYKQEKVKAFAIAQFWKDYEQNENKIVELQKKVKELETENNKLKRQHLRKS